MRVVVLFLFVCLLATGATLANDANAVDYSRGVSTLTEYFDLLLSGNVESAGFLWRQDVAERAQRFGITYTDIPIKVDCNSPVIRNLEFWRDHLHSPVKSVTTLANPAYLRLQLNSIISGEVYKHFYYAEWQGEYAWLVHAQDYFAEDWPIVESKYFRIHVHPKAKTYLTPAAMASADAFIERMGKTLDLSGELKNEIAEKKIEYFYCNDDQTVEQIIGHRVQGTFDLPTNDIISATFPHFHEILHLLTNAKLKEIPLFTLPLFREGVAVHYGGRWGKGPNALTDLGIFMHRQEIVPFDSILTMYDFSNYSGADIAYPVAGVFSGYIVDRYGQDRYFDVYRAFSGPFEKLNAMAAEDIQKKLATLLEQADWATVMADFNGYLDTYAASHAVAKPGGLDKAKPLLEHTDYSVAQKDDWLVFVFRATPDDTIAGSLFWGDIGNHEGTKSSLFVDQFKDTRPFSGHHYAVRYDQYEVGLYDYASNQLLAKYIWGITPSESYFDESDGTVRICFKKSLISELPAEENIAFSRP